MKILITGGSGFLGRNILKYFNKDNNIYTLGLHEKDTYQIDLSTKFPNFDIAFDLVIHAAGKAHSFRNSPSEEQEYYTTNFLGTKNLCNAFKEKKPKAIVFISTVAVYGLESGSHIDETYPLLGKTPYALSKIMAENYLIQWCKNNNVNLTILRPPLLAGPTPPGNLGAMIRSIKNGTYMSISNGSARKSLLMVDDIGILIPRLLDNNGIYNICDDTHPSFRELEILISTQLNKRRPFSLPLIVAKIIASIGNLLGERSPINTNKLKKMTNSLTFSNNKAKLELDWRPLNVLENFKI